MRSIRRALVVGTVAATVMIVAVAGTVIHRSVHAMLFDQLDLALEDEAMLLASTIEVEPDSVELGFTDLGASEFEPGDSAAYLQLWMGGSTVMYRSPSLEGADLAPPAEGGRTVFSTTRLSNGRQIRTAGITFRPRVEVEGEHEKIFPVNKEEREKTQQSMDAANVPVVSLVLARETKSVDSFLVALRNLLAAIGALTALISGGVLFFVIRRNLAPLDHLAAEISTLDHNKLASRVALSSTPRELTPVVDRLNELLIRLEQAFQREKTFSADIAHELRTPLAGLRSAMEVALSQKRQADDYEQTLSESLEIVQRIQRMVQTMLYLGRLDAGQVDVEERTVLVEELVRISWKNLEDVAAARGIEVDWDLSADATVETDPILLEVAIRNILENAVEHANDGGYVRVQVKGAAGSTDIRVANSGSSVEQDQISSLMDRFVRTDEARDSTTFHSGLGLAIVARIAEILGVSIDVRSRRGGEFEVTMSMAGAVK